jgi:hypothetical protein
MEIKTQLNKPYTEDERADFIVEQNHNNGYEIRETETALEAWGYTQSEKEQQERERIANLSLTKRDVFLALYKDKGITPEQIKAQITNPEALIEFEYASSYYRGNPLIDVIGQTLGYTSEQLDYLFEHKELPEE